MRISQLSSALHLLLVLLLQLQLRHQLIYAQTITSSANLSTSWTFLCNYLYDYSPMLANSIDGIQLACGLYFDFVYGNCVFAVYITYTTKLWFANRDGPLRLNDSATVQLSNDGELLLKDANGSLVWSTGTAGKGVVGMKLTERGNLVLFNANDAVVWQSFDHPTDTLVSGQSLLKGKRLTADVSPWNSTPGPIFISSFSDWFGAFVGSDPPRLYFNISEHRDAFPNVTDKALTFVADSSFSSDPNVSTFQFLRLEYDGHIKVYRCVNSYCRVIADKTGQYLNTCDYPTACGPYGICESGQCSCPGTRSFRPESDRRPELGCSPVAPLSCQSAHRYELLRFKAAGSFISTPSYPNITTEERCQEACLNNCSCKAALFRYDSYPNGSCFLQQEVFSLVYSGGVITAFVKAVKSKISTSAIVGITIGAFVGLLMIAGLVYGLYGRSRTRKDERGKKVIIPPLPEFSYEDLSSATNNFNKKLGGGGFGSVFDGALADGTRIAVKKLETVNQGEKEFLAEVETIGSIHHLNLVRLLGYCAELSHRLLVYEHMSNGSLDKWIFRTENNHELSWEVLRNIIYQVAKGLTYLHEECRQKIAHLDIKPENILLDPNFNAKVADFGLAKLIDRDQSAVVTMMRGTPGYLAPEWLLTSMITEKVDVYSFGVVVAEIVCGRRNVDFSKPEGYVLLLPLIREKTKAGQLLDVIDKRKTDVNRDGKDLEEMLKLSIWCVQQDPSRRPSMSTVVKVLEGTIEMAPDLDYDLGIPVQNVGHKIDDHSSGSAPLIPSVLSGPR